MKRWRKPLAISLGALVLSTLGIQASDMLQGIDGNLSALISDSSSVCGDGAVQLLLGGRSLCVDTYEASPASACPHANVQGQRDTQDNLNEFACQPVSLPAREPWKFVSLTEAQQLCARSGKRLPTNEEWYRAVSGFGDQSTCNTSSRGSGPGQTGTFNCVSPLGVHDLIGNVWEWVDGQVIDGTFDGRPVPSSGYVAAVDTVGVVTDTAGSPEESFGADYAWTNETGVRGMIRGGYYGSGEDAGIFTQNLAVDTNFRVVGVGFRCVRDV